MKLKRFCELWKKIPLSGNWKINYDIYIYIQIIAVQTWNLPDT